MAAQLIRKILRREDANGDDTAGVSLSQVAWDSLRADIISGKLAPDTRLRIAGLRSIYGIGASPLREALSRLVADGFVISVDRRGFIVAPISLREFRDLTDLRKLLEKEALRLSITDGDDAWEAGVIGACHRLSKAQARLSTRDPGSFEEWERLNREFHESLVAACPSAWILRFRRSAYDYAERYRRLCLSLTAVSRDVQKEHYQLRDAAIARDVDSAHALIDDHLERTFRKVESSKKLKNG
jgi:GntR family transcriptional regulator, carbon starvation induced regulator